MFAAFNEAQRLELTLYTDALITRGSSGPASTGSPTS